MKMKDLFGVALAITAIFVGIDLSKYVLAKILKPKTT